MYLLLSCVPSWAQSARSFWSQPSKFMAVEEDPRIEEVTQLPCRCKLRRLRLRRLCGLRKGCGHGRRALRQVRTRRPQGCRCHCQDHGRRRPALWKRRRLSSVRAIPSTASLLTITRASRPVQLLQPCTAAPRPAPLPVLVWATAPRCVSSMLSTLWTALPRWTRTSAPAAVPAQTSAPSRSS